MNLYSLIIDYSFDEVNRAVVDIVDLFKLMKLDDFFELN